MHNVFCFNGFNQTAIVMRYSAHIKPRKMIKTVIYVLLCVIISCYNSKKWLKSVYIYRCYRKIKTGVPLFWNTL